MTEPETLEAGRVRRTFNLVNYCIANIAAYRVNWHTIGDKRTLRVTNDFWVRANGNFFDMAVIEWCKLFAEKQGQHHWSKTFTEQQTWKCQLLEHLEISDEEYEMELKNVKDYRNKYVAHLDSPTPMSYPLTEFMLISSSYLYNYIRTDSMTKIHIGTIYESAHDHYMRMMSDYNEEIKLRLNESN